MSTNAVFTATQRNLKKSIKASCVENVPTTRCSLIHKSTAAPVSHTESTLIERFLPARVSECISAPTSPCACPPSVLSVTRPINSSLSVSPAVINTMSALTQPAMCSDGDQVAIHPLALRFKAWAVIPGISQWVLNTIKLGYRFQFRRRPPRFERG